MQKLDTAEIAAVAVTKSRRNTCTHCRYSSFVAQIGSDGAPLHTQLPPVSLIIAELTAMIYA